MATFQPVTEDQEAPFGQPAVAGDDWPNSGYDFMLVRNARAANIVVVVEGQGRCSMGATHERRETITASFTRLIGPFDRHQFNDAGGYAQFRCFAADGVTPLPNEDGQGHPNNVGVLFIRMIVPA